MSTLKELMAALTDPAYYRNVGSGLLDAYNRGAVGGLLGTPVDMANGVINAGKMAAGYVGHKTGLLSADQMPQPDTAPIGGSEWWGQKMQNAGMVSSQRNAPAEMIAGVAGIPLTALAAQKIMPGVETAVAKMANNATSTGELNTPAYGGQRGAFIGPKSKLWDKNSEQAAINMELNGFHPREIWKSTGTWRGPDGNLRQEISDANAAFKNVEIPISATPSEQFLYKPSKGIPLDEAISHPELMSAYDSARRIEITRTETPYDGAEFYLSKRGRPNISIGSQKKEVAYPGMFGSKPRIVNVSESPSSDEKIRTLMHEVQHYIQAKEGFSAGGNENMFYSSIIDPVSGMRIPPPISPRDSYLRLAGEAEARAVAARARLTSSQRIGLFPEDSYDVPINDLIFNTPK